jgi:hypothetical protein
LSVVGLLGVVTADAHIVSLDRLQAEPIGDLLGLRFAVERIKRREVRRPHPLLHFGLMTFRAGIGADDFCWSVGVGQPPVRRLRTRPSRSGKPAWLRSIVASSSHDSFGGFERGFGHSLSIEDERSGWHADAR